MLHCTISVINNVCVYIKILNAIEIIRDKMKKRPDIDTIHDYIMKTEASNANKTLLIENLVKELNKHNILINKKTTKGLDSFKILNNVDQTSQTSYDQTLSDPLEIMNATKTLDTEDKETYDLRNSVRDMKVKKDGHSEQVKDNKRVCDELEIKNTIINLLIGNFKQTADSIGKSNTTASLLQTPNFSENRNVILPKKYAHREPYNKSKPTNILSPNRYQLLEPTSENTESVSENIQNTDSLRLPGNENQLHRNRNVLTSQNTGNKRHSLVIIKYPERQTDFSRPPVVPGTKLLSEVSLTSKDQRGILISTDSIPMGIRIRELNSFIKKMSKQKWYLSLKQHQKKFYTI